MIIPVTKTESGKNAIGIGGGSFTKKFCFRAVIGKETGRLKPALFIRSAGDLSCRTDQGLTEIEIGDLVIIGSGFLPIKPDNPSAYVDAYRITAIDNGIALTSEGYNFPIGDLPDSVITGASLYHNRDGTFFSGGSS